MPYVLIEFYDDVAPCLADADWPLTAIGDKLSLSWREMVEQTGPVVGSIMVYHHNKPIAIYRELPSLREFM